MNHATVIVLGSASLEVTTSRVYRSGTGASVRSVIVVFWPCGIALISGRSSNSDSLLGRRKGWEVGQRSK
jgi:hypothetical protein